ncbi:MAG: sugar ABC transporter permease [Thermomicrobiales bacterium]|nr:sugar ABC transporter permease [Thermomicrobiales bacterium]
MAYSMPHAQPVPNRDRLAVVLGIVATILLLTALLLMNRLESRYAFITLGAFVAVSAVFLAITYSKRPYIAFVFPAVVIYTMFVIFPAGAAFRYSLYNWTGLGPATDFIGFANYTEILRDAQFRGALWNNVQLFLAIFVIQNVIGLPIALALDTKLRGHEFYRSALFLPVIVSLVATAYIWQIILGPNIGMLNPLLEKIGQPDLQRDWLANTFLTFKLIWIVQAWQHIGVPIVIYLAGLQSVPTDLKDSARVDGANGWQVFKGVTFPMLAPAFTIVTISTFIGMFRAFDIPYVLGGPGGAPDGTTDVLSLVIYREAFGLGGIVGTQYRQGYAVAAGVVMFAFLIVAVSVQAVFLRRREVAM